MPEGFLFLLFYSDAAYVFVNGELRVDYFRLVSVEWATLREETVARAVKLVKQTVSADYSYGYED